VHNKAATSNDARANYFQKLGKTGLADIEAIEIDWMPEVMKYSDLLAPVPADLKGRWLDWKEKGATDSEGNLIGYGTDIGPEGVCYRSDLFAAAGLPTDRDEVAKLLQGDWANYFKVGADYTAKTGKAFFDSAASMLALFTFVSAWNNFFWPFIVLDRQNPTLPVALSLLQSNYFVDYSIVLAGVLLATIPLLILFVFAGRQLVSGIMQGAVKG